MKKLILLAVVLTGAALTAHAQVSQWVAFNDHYSGPNTGTNVTTWNIFGTTGGAPGSNGFLTNVITGAQLPVSMTLSNVTNGVTGGASAAGPVAGTPAAMMFTNYIDWGSGTINHAVQLSAASKIVHAFSGLDPSRRYSWHGSAVRGNNYNLRWSLVEISATSWLDAHTMLATGVFTSAEIPSLTSSQAVFNSGENRAPGVVVGWTNIAPNPDGTIFIYQTTYRGPFPAGSGFNFDTGNYGYAMMADRLEEFTVGPTTPVGITNQPQSMTLPERGTVTFSLMATGSPQYIQWYRSNDGGANFAPIPGAVGSSYTIAPVVYPGDNGARFRATVTNSVNAVTSSVATLTVSQDLAPPTVIRAVGDPDPTKVHLTFSEPVDPSTISESSLEIFVTGTVPGGSYITFGATLTNGTNVTITTDPRQPGTSYSVQLLDVRDASSGNNLINPNPLQVPIITTVQLIGFDTDNEWKYFLGSDIFGTGWELPGYDDSTWLSGASGLGLDTSANGVPIRTTIAYMAQSEPVWFRKHFNFPGKTNGVVLTLRDVVEDGAVYYLNGQELYRHNVSAGALTYATRTTAGQADPTPIQGPFNLAITNLLPGDNLLAVVVIQSGATSSDVELAVELNATIQEFLTGPPKITLGGQPQNQTVPEGGNVTFGVSIEGAIPLFYTWKKNGVAIPNATNASYSIVSVVPTDAGTYSVSVTNSFGGTNSTTATLTVNADTTPPIIVSAIGDTNLNVVTVTLRDPQPGRGINLPSANDPTHYQIQLRGGGGVLPIVTAVATNIGTNTIVTLTTATGSPRVIGQDYNVIVTGVVDNSVAANAVTPNTAQISARMVLFPYTQTWRYDQSGTDLGTTWKDVGYNDGAWLSGPAILGFETTSNTLFYFTNTIMALPFGTNTVLSLTNGTLAGIGGTNITFYFRTTVNIPFNPAGATFTARAYIDDGAIFYVNGVESLRFNYNTNISYTNFAAGGLTEPTPNPSTTTMSSNIGGFVQGANVVAVEVHQETITSSDIDFGMQLEALVSSFNVITGPRLNISRNLTTGQVTISWTGGGTLQQASALSVSGASGWSDVPGNPNPYTFTPVAGQNRFFSLRP